MIKAYRKKTQPLSKYYEKMNKFYSVSGVGEIDDISKRLIDLIENLI